MPSFFPAGVATSVTVLYQTLRDVIAQPPIRGAVFAELGAFYGKSESSTVATNCWFEVTYKSRSRVPVGTFATH